MMIDVLRYIADHPRTTIPDIMDGMGIKRKSAKNEVWRLQNRGFVDDVGGGVRAFEINQSGCQFLEEACTSSVRYRIGTARG